MITVLVTTVAGAALVWIRLKTGSIWAPVAVHAGMNMTLAVFARMAAQAAPRGRAGAGRRVSCRSAIRNHAADRRTQR